MTTVKIQCKMASLKEAINKTISDKLRVLLNVNPPINKNEAIMMVSNVLSAFNHVMWCSVYYAMDTSLGIAVFNRCVLINNVLLSTTEVSYQCMYW